jgi:hypothetical protein
MIYMKEKLPSLILRIMIVLYSAAGVLICVFAVPPFGTAVAKNFPDHAFWQYPIIIGLYAAALCFFFALFQFWLLLNGVDRHGTLSTKNLRAIRLSAIAFSVLFYVSAMPVIFLFAEADDAPGAILIGAFLGMLPVSAAAGAAILERISVK